MTLTEIFHGEFMVGDPGPGGGTVIYAAPVIAPWGRYIEMAPDGWFGSMRDPREVWDRPRSAGADARLSDCSRIPNAESVAIGAGMVNSVFIVKSGVAGAALMARDYQGGGLTDWYLPARNELMEMYKSRARVSGVSQDYYWSSSQNSANLAWSVQMGNGVGNFNLKHLAFAVRPVRSFA